MSKTLGILARIAAFALIAKFVLPLHLLGGAILTGGFLALLLTGGYFTLAYKGIDCFNKYILHTEKMEKMGNAIEILVSYVGYALALGLAAHLPFLGLAFAFGHFATIALGGMIITLLDRLLVSPAANAAEKLSA